MSDPRSSTQWAVVTAVVNAESRKEEKQGDHFFAKAQGVKNELWPFNENGLFIHGNVMKADVKSGCTAGAFD
jgi:hypothetical protein